MILFFFFELNAPALNIRLSVLFENFSLNAEAIYLLQIIILKFCKILISIILNENFNNFILLIFCNMQHIICVNKKSLKYDECF